MRAYAIQHPEMIDGILFIDPTYEDYINFNQSHEDMLVNSWVNNPWLEEANQFLEGIQYIAELPALPDVPVTVLSSMKTSADLNDEDRQSWFDARESLGEGVTHFKHIGLENSGHYIQLEEPSVLIQAIRELVEK